MKRILLTLLLVAAATFGTTAKNYTVDSVPNVQVADQRRFVSNPDGILSPEAVYTIDTMLYRLRTSGVAEVAVVAVESIGFDEPREFATSLFRHWGLGDKEQNNGLLVLLVLGQGAIEIETGYGIEGDLPEFPDAMAAIRFEAGAIGEKFLSVSAGEHAEPLTEGFTAVLGDARELYAAPSLAEIYTNEGLNPNAEGFPLDYRWIRLIDWDEDSETYGAYTPATVRGREVWESVSDGAFSVYVEGGAAEGESASRGPTQVSCSGGAALLVKNSYLYSEGLEGMAISNNGSAGVGSTLVVQDSLFVTRGYVPASAGVSENLPNDPLLVTGADRTNLSGADFSTAFNFDIDPEANTIKKAKFSSYGLQGLLTKYNLQIV